MKNSSRPLRDDSKKERPENDSENRQASSTWAVLFRLLPFLINFALLAFLQWRYDVLQYIAPDQLGTTITNIRAWASGFGNFAPLVALVVGSLSVLLNAPVFIVIFSSVVLFGTWFGGVLAFGILLCGLTLIFLVAGWVGRPVVQRFFPKFLNTFNRWMEGNELIRVIMIRLIFYLNRPVNWLLCVSNVGYRNLMIGTLIGAMPSAMVQIWIFHDLIALSQTGQLFDFSEVSNVLGRLTIPLGLLLVLRMWWPRYMERRRQYENPHPEPNNQDGMS